MTAPDQTEHPPHGERGSALLIILTIIGIGAAVLLIAALNKANFQIGRDKVAAAALARAKEALIGFAATYRDSHPSPGPIYDQVFGYLPCPDATNTGTAAANCGLADISVAGHLPWGTTLGLPDLRDSSGECLWYTVSGTGKDNAKTSVFNWDTPGQFIVQDAGGTILAGVTPHERPLAVVFAPRASIGGQSRTLVGPPSVCGGNTTLASYLEGAAISPAAGVTSTITLSTAASVAAGTNNDQGVWITSKDIFDRVKKRSDFAADINALLTDLSNCLNNQPVLPIPNGSKGIGSNIETAVCVPPTAGTQKGNVYTNWKDNLLYANPVTSVNGDTTCKAVLLFGGERTARTVAPLTAQTRSTALEKNDPGNYLEGANATLFPGNGAYLGATGFIGASAATASADIVRCIKGLGGATQKSFHDDFGSFVPVGGSSITTDPANKTVTIVTGGGSGGCFWFPNSVPLAGQTLRAYYEDKFSNADTYALAGSGTDRGNGFTFQMVRRDLGPPTGVCGRVADMGALAPGVPVWPGDLWGLESFTIETDVHRDATNNDPNENHTAIMAYGNPIHSALNGNTTAACDGTAPGCRHTPANTFEESPTPLLHNQRIEIHSGCNSTCSSCTPTNHVAPNTYVRISAWVDCTNCNDIALDFLGSQLIAATKNQDFSAAGNWVGTNWSIMAGAFSHSTGANAATLPNAALTNPPVAGSTYQIKATVTTITPGTLVIAFGGTSAAAIGQAAGVLNNHTVQLTAVSAGTLTLTPDANWTGTIDDITVTPLNSPTINRCINLDPEMNSFYFGFTGGFSAAGGGQGVTISNFYLRSE